MQNKKRISYYIIFSGFIIHLILGTLHSWSSLTRYFHSFLVQHNSIKISKVYLNNIFSFVIVFNNIFILIGILLTKSYNTITITGCGLLLKIYANITIIFFPNIIIVTFCLFICSAACGICYMPIILEIWKYFPDNKGLTTSLALSGNAFTQLLFEDISINIINYEKHKIDYIEGLYSNYVNESFRQYYKMHIIFFAVLSLLGIFILYPHDTYKKYLRKVPRYNFQIKNLMNDANANENNDEADNNDKNGFNQSAHLINIQDAKINGKNSYLSIIKNFFVKKKEKKRINTDKKYEREESIYYEESKNDLAENLMTDVHLLKVTNIKQENYKHLFSLISSYPFLQLTSVFFFTKLFGIIELCSIKNFGALNGYNEVKWI